MNIGQRIKSGEDIHTEFKTSFGDEVIVTLVAFANIFKTTGDIEKYGTGVKRVCQMFLDYGLPIPKWEVLPEGMLVTVFTGKDAEVSSSAGDERKNITENVQESSQKSSQKILSDGSDGLGTTEKILRLLTENPNLTNQELANQCGLTEDGIYYNIKKLKQKGLITRIGPDKGGYWQVNDNITDTETI